MLFGVVYIYILKQNYEALGAEQEIRENKQVKDLYKGGSQSQKIRIREISFWEKREKPREESEKRKRQNLAINQSKVRVGLAFSNNGLYNSEKGFNLVVVVSFEVIGIRFIILEQGLTWLLLFDFDVVELGFETKT